MFWCAWRGIGARAVHSSCISSTEPWVYSCILLLRGRPLPTHEHTLRMRFMPIQTSLLFLPPLAWLCHVHGASCSPCILFPPSSTPCIVVACHACAWLDVKCPCPVPCTRVPVPPTSIDANGVGRRRRCRLRRIASFDDGRGGGARDGWKDVFVDGRSDGKRNDPMGSGERAGERGRRKPTHTTAMVSARGRNVRERHEDGRGRRCSARKRSWKTRGS